MSNDLIDQNERCRRCLLWVTEEGCGCRWSKEWQTEKKRADAAEARLAAVRAFAEEMRGWCSPNGVAVMYADRLVAVLEEREAAE